MMWAVAARLEPKVTIAERPMVDCMGDALLTAVLASRAAWATGGIGLVLAVVGAFGVFAYAVEERRYEVGIRLALGARRKHVVALVFGAASRAFIWRLGAGLVLSLMAVPLFRHVLFGLNLFDPVAYAEVVGILATAAGESTWVPARRAAAVDPAGALRGIEVRWAAIVLPRPPRGAIEPMTALRWE